MCVIKYNGVVKKLLMPFILILSLGCIAVFITTRFLVCRGYTCISFADQASFAEIERMDDTDISYRAQLKKEDILVRIEAYKAVSTQIADRFTLAKIMQLQGLYETARSPYPGALSNEVVCEEKFKPTISENMKGSQKITYVSGFLNERLQYGVCIASQLTHIGTTAMFFCEKQGKWYYFEATAKKLDTNLKKISHLIQSLTCQKSP